MGRSVAKGHEHPSRFRRDRKSNGAGALAEEVAKDGAGERTRSQVGAIFFIKECAARDPASFVSQAHSVRLSSPYRPKHFEQDTYVSCSKSGAGERTRTSTLLRALAPKASVSTSFTTPANSGKL